MPRAAPKRVLRYSREFKLAAVRLSQVSGLQVQAAPRGPAREIALLQVLERKHAVLQEEHDLLKKAIRFCASRKPTRSRSSTRSAARTGSRASADASA